MLGGKTEFLPVAAAYAKLVDAPVAHKVVAAAQHTGVAELGAQVIVPQIGGVKVDDVQIGVLAQHRPHRFAQGQAFFGGIECLLRAVADGQIRQDVADIAKLDLDIVLIAQNVVHLNARKTDIKRMYA